MRDTADNLDKAAELQQLMNDAGIEDIRRKVLPETHPDFDGLNCVECGNEIASGRLALLKVRCIQCQTLLERSRAITR